MTAQHTAPRNLILWDIETAANQRAKDYFSRKVYKAPSNWKDKAKIEDYVSTARHEEQSKAGLRWWTGRIVCASLRWLGDKKERKTFVGPDEAELIRCVFDLLEAESQTPVLIGKNGDTFDRPFLIGRALALDLGIPHCLRPWRPIDDVNQMFGHSARCDQIGKLDEYAFGLGVKMKSGHGSDIQAWTNLAELGDEVYWDKIAGYCKGDVDIIHEMLRRWEKPYVSRLVSTLPENEAFNLDNIFGPAKPTEDVIPTPEEPLEFD